MFGDVCHMVMSIVSDAVWGCLGVPKEESCCIWVVFWDVKAALEFLGGTVHAQYKVTYILKVKKISRVYFLG